MDKFINRKREKDGISKDNNEKANNAVDIEKLISKCFDCFVEGKNDEFLLCFQELEENKTTNNNVIYSKDIKNI